MEREKKKAATDATLGELVAALAEEAFFLAQDEEEATVLFASMLDDLFDRPDAKIRRWQ